MQSSNSNNTVQNILKEQQPDYEKASNDLLKDALERSYTDRFLMATRLYKIQQTLNKAKITHKPYNV